MKNGVFFNLNSLLDWVKKQKLIAENKPLKRWVREQSNERARDQIVQPAPIGHELEGLVNMRDVDHDGFIPEEYFMSTYNQDTLRDIMKEQMNVVELLKKHGKTKHMANRILIVFDDLVGSSLFSEHKDNPFKMLNANHRHYSFSMLMVTQAYKEIPKTVRTQFSCVIVFEIANEKEVEVIYEENPMSLKREAWQEMYLYATEGDHNFMFLNYQKPKLERVMKNFKEVLFFR